VSQQYFAEQPEAADEAVLVFLRRHEEEIILCVNNLSRFAQPGKTRIPGSFHSTGFPVNVTPSIGR